MSNADEMLKFILEQAETDVDEEEIDKEVSDEEPSDDEESFVDNMLDDEEDSEDVDSRIDRLSDYKDFIATKEMFFKIKDMVEKKYRSNKILTALEMMEREFDSYTEFYNKMDHEQMKKKHKEIREKFLKLLDIFRK